MVTGKYAILIDGAFATRCIERRHREAAKKANSPVKPGRITAADIESHCASIKGHAGLANLQLLRIFFYDAAPASGVLQNPIDQSTVDLGSTSVFSDRTSLHQTLELQPDFALRMGEAAVHGWTIGQKALAELQKTPRALVAKDLVPNVEQKGVDLRIGLDIARLAIRGLVDVIVVVTGDSDLVPAFRFARREGVRVFLDHMAHGVRRDLKVHADVVL